MKQTLIELKGEIDKPILDFKTSLPGKNKTDRKPVKIWMI